MKYAITFILFSLLVTSCVTIYQPSTVVAPLLEKKGDMEVQATFRKAAVVSKGATINASFSNAFSEKFAAIVNLEYTNETYKPNKDFAFDFDVLKNKSAELYLGRYHSTPNRHTAFFLGFGRGNQDLCYKSIWYSTEYIGRFSSDYLKGSALFEYTKRKAHKYGKEAILLTFFTRLNYVHNYNMVSYFSEENVFTGLEKADKNFFNLEPGLNLSFRFGKFDVFLQGLFSLNLNDYANIETIDFYNTTGSFALGTRLNLNYKPRE